MSVTWKDLPLSNRLALVFDVLLRSSWLSWESYRLQSRVTIRTFNDVHITYCEFWIDASLSSFSGDASCGWGTGLQKVSVWSQYREGASWERNGGHINPIRRLASPRYLNRVHQVRKVHASVQMLNAQGVKRHSQRMECWRLKVEDVWSFWVRCHKPRNRYHLK